jgi:hypothetical protein
VHRSLSLAYRCLTLQRHSIEQPRQGLARWTLAAYLSSAGCSRSGDSLAALVGTDLVLLLLQFHHLCSRRGSSRNATLVRFLLRLFDARFRSCRFRIERARLNEKRIVLFCRVPSRIDPSIVADVFIFPDGDLLLPLLRQILSFFAIFIILLIHFVQEPVFDSFLVLLDESPFVCRGQIQ